MSKKEKGINCLTLTLSNGFQCRNGAGQLKRFINILNLKRSRYHGVLIAACVFFKGLMSGILSGNNTRTNMNIMRILNF
uniref:Phosphoadenosine phosphosulfate reductase n=1 Tax=uncultured marine virus TaxID=186617 RepID=A0A0F7L4P5_9VIRU|nr:phosphoadenosine phosphosulfate reductase [uncultured marine virus]